MRARLKKILITGAAGFVGAAVLGALHQRGLSVHAVVRPRHAAALQVHPAVAALTLSEDLFSERSAWWQRCLDGASHVLHLAWHVHTSNYASAPQNLQCLQGTLRLAAACVQSGVQRFVGVGTCFEYAPAPRPLPSTARLLPATRYGAAKAAAFLSLARTLPQQGLSFAWPRLFYLYGDAQDYEPPSRWAPQLRQRLQRGEVTTVEQPTLVRDYLPAREAAQRLVDVLLGEDTGALNICSGLGQTRWDFAQGLAQSLGAQHCLRPGATPPDAGLAPYLVGVPSQITNSAFTAQSLV